MIKEQQDFRTRLFNTVTTPELCDEHIKTINEIRDGLEADDGLVDCNCNECGKDFRGKMVEIQLDGAPFEFPSCLCGCHRSRNMKD